MKILVFGGSGFLGQSLCHKLLKDGNEVTVFSLKTPGIKECYYQEILDKVEWFEGDFSDASTVEKAVNGKDIIYHLISTTIPSTSNKNLIFDLSSNVISTIGLLNIMVKCNVKKIIYISSGGTVYGIPDGKTIDETHLTNPICGYGIHKITIEKYLYLFNYHYDIDYTVLRLSNPYGIQQVSNRPQGVIGNFIYKIFNDLPIEIWGDGSIVRDYIHIDDVIAAMIRAASNSSGVRVFNISSGIGHSLLNILEIIKECTDREILVDYKTTQNVDVPYNVLNNGLAKDKLGWSPEIDLKHGIQCIVDEYENRCDK